MMSNTEIEAEMFVSVNTVKTHLKHIYRKLDVTDRRHAVRRGRDQRRARDRHGRRARLRRAGTGRAARAIELQGVNGRTHVHSAAHSTGIARSPVRA
jgi:regulatory LuxR family protein